MYAAPLEIQTSIYARMPEELYRTEAESDWIRRRGAGPLHSFLEGPSFDRQGNLYCVDLAHGRLFRITPEREWSEFADYDGEPNGLALHRDGRVFVADHRHGIVIFDPVTGRRLAKDEKPYSHVFQGLNDLRFGSNGQLFVTDQGRSGIGNPSGSVYRLHPDGRRDLIFSGLAAPNGLVLNEDETILYVSVTRTNQVMAFPLSSGGGGSPRARMFLQLSGSPTGPDGMALDRDGNLAVVHAGFGTVWIFSRLGEPLWRVRSCAGMRTTNVAHGLSDPHRLFVTEAEYGVILEAEVPVPGRCVYGLS